MIRRHFAPLLAAPLLAALLVTGVARAATLLRLSETATLHVPPDELVASLSAQAAAPSAAAAQAAVNRDVAAALAAARLQPGVAATTGGYGTWQHPPGTPGAGTWQASQGITLTGHDGTKLLTLVGRLQGRGLAVGGLRWDLSDTARRAAQRQAMAKAITALRGRAEQAAGLLGLRFVAFRSVTLGPPPSVMPRPMFRAAMAAPAPSAVGSAIAVSATVSAEAELAPK